jgi:hypothetical protein
MLTYWCSSRAPRLPRRLDGSELEIKIEEHGTLHDEFSLAAGIAVRVAFAPFPAALLLPRNQPPASVD